MTDWQPSASIEQLRKRADLFTAVRRFFQRVNVFEVDTPALVSSSSVDAHIQSPQVVGGRYLHSSAEPAMKRLLAAGSGDIYQLSHVYRAGEQGRWHNSEFMLLEWYRLGFNSRQLQHDVSELLHWLLDCCGWNQLRLAATKRLTYRQAFQQHAGIDPLRCTAAEVQLRGELLCTGSPPALATDDLDGWLDWLGALVVFPKLGFSNGQPALTFLEDFPASQAALARLKHDDSAEPVAERFEVFVAGIELANGYFELADADEQRRRLGAAAAGNARFIAALEHGLPDCSGVALGVDRLLALMTGSDCLANVLPFDFERI